MRLPLYFVVTLFSSIASFSAQSQDNINNSPSINELINLTYDSTRNSGPIGENKESKLRLIKLRETAVFLGIQSGFNSEIKRIHAGVKRIDGLLDSIFDFGVLMRSTNSGIYEAFLLPAIINEVEGKVVVSSDGKNISHTERSIEFLENEKFVTEQPNWRGYLLFNPLKEFQPPFNALLPKDKKEKEIWAEGIKEGWVLGVQQANKEVSANAENLGRDFIGMTKSIRVNLEGKIKSSSLSFSRELMETDGNLLDINITRYQISNPARFNADTGQWEIIATSTRESLRAK